MGKTTFGQKLAGQLGRVFLDTDHLIEEIWGLAPRAFVLTKGEEAFRQAESEVIEALAGENQIIAVGGGAVLRPKNVEKLLALGKLMYLQCSPAVIKKRLLKPPYPTFLDPYDLEASFERVYQERIKLYETIPAFVYHLDQDGQ